MKRIGTIALAVLLTGGVVGNNPALAEVDSAQVISIKVEDTTNYMRFAGVIKELETTEKEIRHDA